MLQAKTEEQKEYVRRRIVDECPLGNSVFNLYDDSVEADIASLSFDTMAEIVDYLRKENEEVEIPTMCHVSADSYGVVYCLYDTPHEDVIQFCKKLAWVKGKDFGYYYEQYIANGRIVIQNK
jgi:hypothetical protein